MAVQRRVVVIGSGAAGMAAAVAAAGEGAEVTVLEGADLLGGTTAISGGGIWIPANPWAAQDVEDSPDEALRYLRALGLGDADPTLAEVHVRQGPRVIRAIERTTPLRWHYLVDFPDYHAELDGGKPFGRSLEIDPVRVAPEALARVRPDPYGNPPVTINEAAAGQPDSAEIARRQREGIAPRGRGLIAALYATLRERGGRACTGVRADKLITSGDAVVGVEGGGERFAGQVVVASGGFERSPELVRTFLRGPMTAPASPPTNRGTGCGWAWRSGPPSGT